LWGQIDKIKKDNNSLRTIRAGSAIAHITQGLHGNSNALIVVVEVGNMVVHDQDARLQIQFRKTCELVKR